MKSNILLIIAIITVLVALVNLSFTLTKIGDLKIIITGLAQDTGLVNLSVESVANINFSIDEVNFGSGKVDIGEQNATLQTDSDTCTRGNWSFSGERLQLDNIGNENLTLNLSSNNDADGFLVGTNPAYQWNVTDLVGETGACVDGTNLGLYVDVNTTSVPGTICSPLQYVVGTNSIRIDFFLRVPEDSAKDERVSTITAVGTV